MRRARPNAILARVSTAGEQDALRTEPGNFRAAGKRYQRAGKGFHQCKLCPPGTPCPPPKPANTHTRTRAHTHTHTHTRT